MRRPTRTLGLTVALAAMSAALVACGGGDAAGDLDTYCDIARAQDSANDDFVDYDDPVKVQTFFEESLSRADKRVAAASEEIRPTLESLRTTQRALSIVMKEHDWDYVDAGDDVAPLTADPAFHDLQVTLDDYDAEQCGISVDTATDDTAAGDMTAPDDSEPGGDDSNFAVDPDTLRDLLESESGRKLFIDEMVDDGLTEAQAACFIDSGQFINLYEIGAANREPDAADAAELFGALDDCGIPADFFD